MNKTTFTILTIIIYITFLPVFGRILDLILGINFFFYVGFLIGIFLCIISNKNIDEQNIVVFAPFGKFQGIVEPGFNIFLFGWNSNFFKTYSKAIFNNEKTLITEHKIKSFDSRLYHKYFDKTKPFDYKLKINRVASLKILDNDEMVKNFYISTGEKNFDGNNTNNNNKSWLKNVMADIDSSLELISLARGFVWWKANSDFNLQKLLNESNRALEELNQQQHFKSYNKDTLEKTFKRYGLDLVNLNVSVSFDNSVSDAIQKQIIDFESHSSAIIQAHTKAKANQIETKYKGRAKTKAVTKSIDKYKKQGLSQQESLHQASIDNDSYKSSNIISVTGPNGSKINSGLLINAKGTENKEMLAKLIENFGLTEQVEEFIEVLGSLTKEQQKKHLTNALKIK